MTKVVQATCQWCVNYNNNRCGANGPDPLGGPSEWPKVASDDWCGLLKWDGDRLTKAGIPKEEQLDWMRRS